LSRELRIPISCKADVFPCLRVTQPIKKSNDSSTTSERANQNRYADTLSRQSQPKLVLDVCVYIYHICKERRLTSTRIIYSLYTGSRHNEYDELKSTAATSTRQSALALALYSQQLFGTGTLSKTYIEPWCPLIILNLSSI